MWNQGEHVLVVGKTGSGKTSLLHSLLKLRAHVLMLATKDDDLPKIGWKIVRRTKDIDPTKHDKWRLQPPHERQYDEFREAIARVRAEGGWCMDVDETYHVCDIGLEDEIKAALRAGRSDGISVVNGIQRPSSRTKQPREVWSEATHIFCGKLTDGKDRAIVGEQVSRDFATLVRDLPRFHFVYINTVTDEVRELAEYQLREALGYPRED